jgi:hypothetical protein
MNKARFRVFFVGGGAQQAFTVISTKVEIHLAALTSVLDSRLRGNDGYCSGMTGTARE